MISFVTFNATLLRRAVLAPLRRRSEAGQALVEYALLISLVAVVLVGSLLLLSTQLGGVFDEAADVLLEAIETVDDGAEQLPDS